MDEFIKELRELLKKFNLMDCGGYCNKCPLNKDILRVDSALYNMCDILKIMAYEMA